MASGPRVDRLALLAIAAGFVAVAWPGAGERGLIAEEIQPYLTRYPHVLERSGGAIQPMPPDEPGAPLGPRWVATSQWPVLAWSGATRIWPVLIRGHQSALGSYAGIALGPLLGDGPAGVRRSSVLLGLVLIALTWAVARRLGEGGAWLAALLLAASFGTVWISRTGYAFELASRVLMTAVLALAAPRRPLTTGRAIAIGVATALALVSRATVGVALLPALAILLAHPARRPGRRAALSISALALGLPLGLLAAGAAIAPLPPGAGPLAGFPLEALWARTARIPAQLGLDLAFVADANTVLGPLARGDSALGLLWPFAAVGAVPLFAALIRWWRGAAGDAERMFVCAALATAVGGAWMYGDPNQFQLALALEPLWALALAHQLAALRAGRPRWAIALVASLLLLRGQALARGVADGARPGNPMLSGRVQHEAVARLRALGVSGTELVTTTYNQAGVLEAWTDGAIRPLHAWPILSSGQRGGARATLDAWRAVLRDRRPRYVLLSDGVNLYDGPFTDNPAIAALLARAADEQGLRLAVDRRFPTERGTPGWSLVRVY